MPAVRRDGDDITDHQLVSRVRAGDDRAFEALYTRYHRRIASYIQGMVHDHARAEDIAQDVFMSALRRMRETDRTIAFKPWVYEIAKNACIDQFRRARRAEEVSMDADEGLGSADYGRLVSSTPTPDVAHDHKQSIDHLRGAFGGLSETHHEILVMRELEGLSYREIGEKLGMTRPAVESTLFRARRRLTEEYDELVTGERCVRVQQIIASAGGSALGTRDKRRVARHVSYCQPCLRHARLSGMDANELVHKPVRQKIAAFLPLPAFLKERWGGDADAGASASFAQWSAQASTVDPGLVSSWGKAAATAATIALAGVGAGVATNKDMLPGSFGGVSLESITGKDNPGGTGGADVTRAGSGLGSDSAGAAGRLASGTRTVGSSTADRASRAGSSTTASDSGSAAATGVGDAAGAGSVTTLAGANSGTAGGSEAAAGPSNGDGAAQTPQDGAGSLLPALGSDGSENAPKDGEGDEGPVLAPPAIIPGDVPAAVGGGSAPPPEESDKPKAKDDESGADSGSPVEVIGNKSAEVIGGLTGGG